MAKRITKKWRIETAREIIDRNLVGVHFSEDDVAAFAAAVGHPVTAAVRRLNPEYPNDNRHLHTEIDGVWAARSWRKLITPLTPEQQAKRIMRHVISSDLRDFASCADPSVCAFCGAVENITVDHVAPPFDEIASNFILEHGLPEIKIPDDPTKIIDSFVDADMEARWIAFHAASACYQLLCRSCNSSKGKR